jgi:hypothetical protein
MPTLFAFFAKQSPCRRTNCHMLEILNPYLSLNKKIRLCLHLFACIVNGQDDLGPRFSRSYFVDIGLGPSTPRGLIFNTHFTAQLNKHACIVAGASQYASDLFVLSGNHTEMSSFFIGAGQIIKRGPFLFRWALEPAFTRITYRRDEFSLFGGQSVGESRVKSVAGIQAETQLLAASGGIGAGLTAFANINTERSYAGIAITVALGKVHVQKK